MSILDNYNELCVQNTLLRTQLKAEREENAALSAKVKDLQQRNTNLHIASVVKPPRVVYRLNGDLYGAEHYCDLDSVDYDAVKELHEFLDGDWSEVPTIIKEHLR